MNGYPRLVVEGSRGIWATHGAFYLSAEEVALKLEDSAVAITGSFLEGEVSIDDLDYPRPEDTLPPVSLNSPAFTGTASSVEGVRGEGQITQVVDDAGLLIPPAVELAPTELTIRVPAGEEVVEVVNVREATFLGDALLAEVSIETDAPDGVFVLRSKRSGSWAAQLVEAGQEGYLAIPAVLVVTTLGTAIGALADALECVFTFGLSCGDGDEPTLDEFPATLAAGEQDSFEIAVHGAGEPGDTYSATLTFVGQNYCPAALSVKVEVVP